MAAEDEELSDFDDSLVGVGGALAGFTSSSDDDWHEQVSDAAPALHAQQSEHGKQAMQEEPAEHGEQQGRVLQAPQAPQPPLAAHGPCKANIPRGDALLRPRNAQRAAVKRRPALISSSEAASLLTLRDSLRPALGRYLRDEAGGQADTEATSVWETCWMHTDGQFQRSEIGHTILQRVAEAAWAVDREAGWNLLSGREPERRLGNGVEVRCIEIHEYQPGGGLAHSTHCDSGSLVTVDVLLKSDFTGGQLSTLETDGSLRTWPMSLGDAAFFPSHKYHCVTPVRTGVRAVLIVEFWLGPRRECAHRCLDPTKGVTEGRCGYRLRDNMRDRMLLAHAHARGRKSNCSYTTAAAASHASGSDSGCGTAPRSGGPTAGVVDVLDYGDTGSLSCFVNDTDGEFFQRFRGKKPVLVRGLVPRWRASSAWAAPSGSFDGLLNAIGPETCVSCLFAKDGTHFFANDLCDASEVSFESGVVTPCLCEKGPGAGTRRYCRLRPLPEALAHSVDIGEPFVEVEDDGGMEAPGDGENRDRNRSVFSRKLCACWIGSRGVVTPLHFDLCHGFLANVVGAKRVTLFPPQDTLYLYRAARSAPNPNSSRVNWENWRDDVADERRRFPKVAEASPLQVTVAAGEALYTPPGWWHTVEGATPTVAVLLPFDMSPDESLHPSLMY